MATTYRHSILLLAIVALYTLSTSVHAQSCPAPGGLTCSDEGLCLDFDDGFSRCACASGTYGQDCAQSADASCSYNNVENLQTENIPLAVSADYTNDELTIVLTSPLVEERTSTNIMIDQSVGSDASCTYPGTYWSRDISNCTDRFTGVMPWLETRGCGWVYDDTDADYFIYRANMIVEHHDLIDPFAGRAGSSPVDRLTTHMVPIELLFQKFVDVTTEITVSAPVTVLAAITRQTVDPVTKAAIIEVTTSALHPYVLTSESLTLLPTYEGYTYSVTELEDQAQCENIPDGFCLQVFRIDIDASSGCEITGDYQITVDVECQIDPSTSSEWDTCAVESDASAELNLDILSEDFCAKVVATVDITGTLTPYQDPTYVVEKSNFLNDQIVYFQADISSPDATLTSSTVASVKLVSGAEEITLFLNNNYPILDAAFTLDGGDAVSANFYFTLRDSYITGIDLDATKDYQVVARIDVTFEGVPGVKRMAFASPIDNREMAVASQIGVQSSNEEGAFGSGASSVTASSFFLLGLPLMYLFAL